MKKILIALMVVFALASCTAARHLTKTKVKIYKQETKKVDNYFTEYKQGRISIQDLQTLLKGSLDYVEYFVAPVKNKYLK